MRLFFVWTGLFVFMGCSAPTSSNPSAQGAPTLLASNYSLTTVQNTPATLDLLTADANGAVLTTAPAHGSVTFNGTVATYRPTNPLYSGSDSFKFKLTKGAATSNEATVTVDITGLTAGTATFTESYQGSAFALNGWEQFTSSFGHTTNSLTEFTSTTFNGAATPSRRFVVFGDSASYAGDATYNTLFGALPIDGAATAMHDWPWKAELLHIPRCGYDATITVKVKGNSSYPMLGILLNYDITKTTAGAYTLNGYQVLLNSGGGSLTLSRFINANEYATAFMDRWPNTNYGTEALANPITSGPYKGWNYQNGVWAAGGNVGGPSEMLVAIRYQYDPATKNTTISYEARAIDGTDTTPGTWDLVVNLTGADSLPPAGKFGLMAMNYHTYNFIQTTDFYVPEFKMTCLLP